MDDAPTKAMAPRVAQRRYQKHRLVRTRRPWHASTIAQAGERVVPNPALEPHRQQQEHRQEQIHQTQRRVSGKMVAGGDQPNGCECEQTEIGQGQLSPPAFELASESADPPLVKLVELELGRSPTWPGAP